MLVRAIEVIPLGTSRRRSRRFVVRVKHVHVLHSYYMSTRTVRLEQESARALAEIRRATGLSTSAVIRRGLVALRERLRETASESPFDLYSELDLGPGGYARAPARRAKRALPEILREKHRK
jgi:hypothetical protein